MTPSPEGRNLKAKILAVLVLTGCGQLGEPGSGARPAVPAPVTVRSTPRDQYEARELERESAREPSSPASGSAVQAWILAGRRALRERLAVRPSFRELVYFDTVAPTAFGYRLKLG